MCGDGFEPATFQRQVCFLHPPDHSLLVLFYVMSDVVLCCCFFFSYQSKISQSGRCYITNSELIWKKKVEKHFPTETYLRTVGWGRSFHMVSLFLWHLLHSLAVMVQNNILWLDGRKETKCRTCFKFPCEESNLTAVLSDLHFLTRIKCIPFLKTGAEFPFGSSYLWRLTELTVQMNDISDLFVNPWPPRTCFHNSLASVRVQMRWCCNVWNSEQMNRRVGLQDLHPVHRHNTCVRNAEEKLKIPDRVVVLSFFFFKSWNRIVIHL